ncbi:NAD(P)/FAD-dependent oxidoreductase [Meiothermus granaticius]|uniref:NADH:ubiquinone reductase (non-electrogenic) n=1 Tax=Meiothermus granaticius NBRC 107808 TaxID=1227551 RepID=A0A399FEY1_9DEIN|nr:NAD(P)/FAD-dependent oxidoreductase [Meiothermus granaticius]MCL6525634.1 NAD(P)/FAD-dependent oxidoreductase [Thermaceae bacterium]RIH93742.1 NADH dehydrogenase-like protein [Meiothermus granaticius NBRC 107808]GEM85735.1 pyridine nucleotide-disulfide oxidoreductase [Meiothermus granaticius NBRC 107808]
MSEKHVVVLGAGFAGLNAVRELAREPGLRITLVDRNNYHLFQPLLYQVASGGLESPQIAFPIRAFLRRYTNACFLMGNAERVDPQAKTVTVDGQLLPYDYLLVGVGTRTNDFGLPGVAQYAQGMKGLEDALRIRDRLISACEEAARTSDPQRRKSLLTTVIVGGGPTGVELAGAFAEAKRHVISRDIPEIAGEMRIVLVEGFGRILSAFSESSSRYAERFLRAMGVELVYGDPVAEVGSGGVRFQSGRFVPSFSTIWAAGVTGVAIPGLPAGRGGRIVTAPELFIPEHPEIYVAGDSNALAGDDGKAYPQVAQTAIQQGVLAGCNIVRAVRGQRQKPFRYIDKGNLATLGRNHAIAEIGRLRFKGFAAWALWLVVHLYYLIGFRNRLLVMANWAYSYFTYDFAVRILHKRVAFPETSPQEVRETVRT